MRKFESIEDQMRGKVTYELDDGRWITMDARQVREHGLKAVLEHYGVQPSNRRLPVFQDGIKIGTLPECLEPMSIRSTSFLYDPRPGDFTREEDRWVASRYLGPGDLESVPEFRFERE